MSRLEEMYNKAKAEHAELLSQVSEQYGKLFAKANDAFDLMKVTMDFTEFAHRTYVENYGDGEHEHEFCMADMTSLAVGIACTILEQFKPDIFTLEQIDLFGDMDDEDEDEDGVHDCENCEHRFDCDEYNEEE